MNVAPGSTFEAFSPELASGLVGTVGVRIRSSSGDDFLARTTASITEDVTVGSTSVYRRSFTAPSSAGQYWIVWDDGTSLADPQELVVTFSTASVSTSNVYVTRDEVLYALDASASTYMSDDVDDAINAASRAIDEACGQRFYPSTETRVYTATGYLGTGYGYGYRYGYGPAVYASLVRDLEIDPLNALTSLQVDRDGDGVYEETWTVGTDFFLDPPNNPLKGYPYTRVVLTRNAGKTFPTVDNGVQIAGSFGWAETPDEVKQYCKIFATQLLLRSREAPFGVLMAGSEVGTSTRIARFDPDFERMLGHLVKPYQLIA